MDAARRTAIHDAMVRLSDGDRAAFPVLLDQLWPVILSFVRRGVGQEADAEDIAQEVFFRICSRITDFDHSRDGLSWAFGIALFLLGESTGRWFIKDGAMVTFLNYATTLRTPRDRTLLLPRSRCGLGPVDRSSGDAPSSRFLEPANCSWNRCRCSEHGVRWARCGGGGRCGTRASHWNRDWRARRPSHEARRSRLEPSAWSFLPLSRATRSKALGLSETEVVWFRPASGGEFWCATQRPEQSPRGFEPLRSSWDPRNGQKPSKREPTESAGNALALNPPDDVDRQPFYQGQVLADLLPRHAELRRDLGLRTLPAPAESRLEEPRLRDRVRHRRHLPEPSFVHSDQPQRRRVPGGTHRHHQAFPGSSAVTLGEQSEKPRFCRGFFVAGTWTSEPR